MSHFTGIGSWTVYSPTCFLSHAIKGNPTSKFPFLDPQGEDSCVCEHLDATPCTTIEAHNSVESWLSAFLLLCPNIDLALSTFSGVAQAPADSSYIVSLAANQLVHCPVPIHSTEEKPIVTYTSATSPEALNAYCEKGIAGWNELFDVDEGMSKKYNVRLLHVSDPQTCAIVFIRCVRSVHFNFWWSWNYDVATKYGAQGRARWSYSIENGWHWAKPICLSVLILLLLLFGGIFRGKGICE